MQVAVVLIILTLAGLACLSYVAYDVIHGDPVTYYQGTLRAAYATNTYIEGIILTSTVNPHFMTEWFAAHKLTPAAATRIYVNTQAYGTARALAGTQADILSTAHAATQSAR